MFKRIVVPLDGSALAEYALAQAHRLAAPVSAEVTLLRVPVLKDMVVQEPAGLGWLLPEQSLARSGYDAETYLQTLQGKWGSDAYPLRLEVEEGDEASVIVDKAAELNADLIAMSTHGLSGLRRWLLGSVAERVLRAATCPVLVTRTDAPIRRIMIALDGSNLAERALGPAMALAQPLDAHITLAHVAAGPGFDLDLTPTGTELERGHMPATPAQLRERGAAYLRDLQGGYWWAGLTVDSVVLNGPVADALLNFAAAENIDCIVMATHGRSGLGRWVYGSMTEKVLRQLESAMLIVRPPRHLLR